MKAFVTGGAGFIGSHIVDKLLEEGNEVTVYDNFCTGRKLFIKHNQDNPKFKVIKADVLDLKTLTESMKGHDFVFHLQANADVRGGINKTRVDLEQNTIATWNVLEAMRINNIKNIVFSSTSCVYGEPDVFPTPEDYPLIQTSLYGASKLAGEGMIQAYCEYYDMRSWIFRFVSWMGERYTHGAVFDFIKKLKNNPKEMEILGDGQQKKSYLYVKDGIEGMFFAIKNAKGNKNVFNLGHKDHLNVIELANIVCEEMGLKDVKYTFTGGDRGWKGDAPFVKLCTKRLKELGWEAKTPVKEAIRMTARYILENPEVLEREEGRT